MSYEAYRVQKRDRGPLVDFMIAGLEASGCQIIYSSFAERPTEAPFRLTFQTPVGIPMGVIAYAFLANSKETKNRPKDEHRFQIKYGGKRDHNVHELWQDPYGLYTTVLVGINPEQGFFVGADPVLHSPTKFFISVEFKQRHADEILKQGWFAWERERAASDEPEPVEVLVGGRKESFFRYVLFEREALHEEQGPRHALAASFKHPAVDLVDQKQRLHSLAEEFELPEEQVLDLIASAPRLKMAVRGWVAEEHLARHLRTVRGVTGCERVEEEGGPDVELLFRTKPLTIECKNVLRTTYASGEAKLDLQRTRASKNDPSSRYYAPDAFDVIAACMHPVTGRWEFRFCRPCDLERHPKHPRKLSNNVKIDERWSSDAAAVLGAAIGR